MQEDTESRLETSSEAKRGSILKSKNLFVFLSFLGILFLGPVMLGFWYLTQPRLAYIYSELPMLVGFALLASYLAVVALFCLIVLSSYSERDLLSAKKITVRILFPLASTVGQLFHVHQDAIRASFIDMNNSLVRASARLVSGDRLLLLLPHCLQNFDCPHRVTSEVRNCRRCGGCEIADLISICDERGIKMSIATGGTLARRVIVETRPKAIVAVACERDLTSGIQDSYPIPVMGVLNERPFGPCRNTRVDLSRVQEAITFFIKRDPPEHDGTPSQEPRLREPQTVKPRSDEREWAVSGGKRGGDPGP